MTKAVQGESSAGEAHEAKVQEVRAKPGTPLEGRRGDQVDFSESGGDSGAGPSALGGLDVGRTIFDRYAACLLLGTDRKPSSATWLSRKFGIPIAACYRRLRELESYGLVEGTDGPRRRNGKFQRLYRSNVKSVRIVFADGRVRVAVNLHGNTPPSGGA